MTRLLHFKASRGRQEFLFGSLFGIAVTAAGIAGLFHFGAFPKESEGLILSADYRLSRTEMRLRQEIQYLEHELAVLRRAHSSTASYPSDSCS